MKKSVTVLSPLYQCFLELHQILPCTFVGAFVAVLHRIREPVWNSLPPTRILEIAQQRRVL